MGTALDALTDKQRIFVHEYATDLDRMRAVREAGYTGKDAALRVQAHKLVNNPKVKAALAELGKPMLERADLSTERVLQQLHDLLFFDPAVLFNEHGYLSCELEELPPGYRQAIKSLDVEEQYDQNGDLVGRRIKVTMVPKEKMLEMAMRYNKLFDDAPKVNVQVNFWDQLYNQTLPADDGLEARIQDLSTGTND